MFTIFRGGNGAYMDGTRYKTAGIKSAFHMVQLQHAAAENI